MSIRFSTDGPAFPEQLIEALLAGEVVFLCGAGVSAPQLPGFRDLVHECFKRLNIDMTASECGSFNENRFEEVLGSLSRRIVDPTDMVRTVMEILQPLKQPDLSHHRAIVRLSRDLENRPVIITTNFDTMLELALLEFESKATVQKLSCAGQDLPSPGSSGFGGIIHLHGRIADQQTELSGTPLIITSADYGDAYMRSGWASRFLFDLCRCKTVVLIGYSAGDAPVRYFLNVLEADRQRFPDLRPVYALDAVEEGQDADIRWGALAVEPLVYRKLDSAHSALWRDLNQLVELVERPRLASRQWVQTILSKSFRDIEPAELDRVSWLFGSRRDLWPIAINTIHDGAWFDFFADRKLWGEKDAPWIVAAWLAREFVSVDNLTLAITWLERLGKPFAKELSRRIEQKSALPLPWLRAWRLLVVSDPDRSTTWEDRGFAIRHTLRGPIVLNADLQRAIDALTPVLRVTSHRNLTYGLRESKTEAKLSDLMWPHLRVRDRDGAPGLVEILTELPMRGMLLAIAAARLQTVIGVALDIDAVGEDFDDMDSAVPSVEPHPQNEYQDGPVFLVELLARLVSAATEEDRVATRSLAETWRNMPGFLGIRLWMHALRNPTIFSANEAISGLLALPIKPFWHIRRELALILRDHAGGADRHLVCRLESRILNEGDEFYKGFTIDEGQADWRGHARDADVWLLLNMLNSSGALSKLGSDELVAINGRRDYLNRDVEERDFFRSYSAGVRAVIGDAQEIIDASDDERLEVARTVIQSPDIDKRLGWNAYCRADPSGAFDTLSQAPLDANNAPLWNDLVGALSFPQKERDAAVYELIDRVFKTLEAANNLFVEHIIHRLADLYVSTSRQKVPQIATWWKRLFTCAVASDTTALDDGRELYDGAINSPGGRLTEAALIDVEQRRKAGEPIEQHLLDAIVLAASGGGRQGAFARAVLIHASGFVVTVERLEVGQTLDIALGNDTAEGAALRAVLVNQSRLSIAASRIFNRHILRGVAEVQGIGKSTIAAAAKIMAPALAIVRGEPNAGDWGIKLSEVHSALRYGPPALREGAIHVLAQWVSQIDGGPAEAWRTGFGPLLAKVWPKERALRERELTPHFADLAVGAAEAFPEALEQLMPYLMRLDRYGGLHAIEKSHLPEQFPRETLTLLWQLFGPGSTGDLHGISEILERMVAADPTIEIDRRLQWLDQRAIRYD